MRKFPYIYETDSLQTPGQTPGQTLGKPRANPCTFGANPFCGSLGSLEKRAKGIRPSNPFIILKNNSLEFLGTRQRNPCGNLSRILTGQVLGTSSKMLLGCREQYSSSYRDYLKFCYSTSDNTVGRCAHVDTLQVSLEKPSIIQSILFSRHVAL